MLPTLSGRIQTRILVTLVVGGLWTLIITPALPIEGSLSGAYGVTFRLLVAVVVLGIGWELLYHGIQQFRWEKDWPTLFGLLTAVNEGLLLWFVADAGGIPGVGHVPAGAFALDFGTVWLVVWLWVNGPMRVPFVRWRFRGGSLLGGIR
jgi:hypothetical protein